MRIAVISCYAYRDTWKPFCTLLNKFWPSSDRYSRTLITDYGDIGEDGWYTFNAGSVSWGQCLAAFATIRSEEAILLFQDDFFLTTVVRVNMIDRALEEMHLHLAGMARVYPCPGANEDYGDPHFGIVKNKTPYRISCQASVWRPHYLCQIASQCETSADFEIKGTAYAEHLPDKVLAWKREVEPWPIQYLCSGVTRGQWNPDAIKLFQEHGIKADLSKRPILP